ncbi:MAG: PQQ-binding-like beta-propeller repeat protein [Bryobacteraceae bacterium]|nr:PQQ-binding-like beta-propeller repeat protein [Bryobacteraceae bacterium]
MNRRQALTVFAAAALSRRAAHAAEPDWPQWRGPRRDGVSAEAGLLTKWPADGPKRLWQANGLGTGYGSLSMAGERVYVQGGVNGRSVVHALGRADGRKLWTANLGPQGSNDRGSGPRGTPTVDADRLYVLTENGDLACLNAADGKAVWSKNILKEFGGSNPYWLLSESPLVDGERLIVTPGGRGAGMVALEKSSGKVIWKSADLNDPAGYASAIVAEVGGVRCYMNLTARAGVGVRAADGQLLWRYERPANRTANCATPVFRANRVFYTSAYGTGCGLLELKAGGGGVESREVYFNRDMMNHHGGVVLVGDHLYGFSNAILTCMEFATGNVVWRDRSVGKGCLTVANGQLYLLGENGTVGLADASPLGYQEHGRFRLEDQGFPAWAYPVVCGGRLYLRNQGRLECYEVRT